MEYRILGPLEVRDDGHIVDIPGLKERAVLALLAVELGTVVASDRIIYELWGDDLPREPIDNLRTLVSRLRRVLGRDAIVSRRPGYRLAVDPDAVDSHRFEELADQAIRSSSNPELAGPPARAAVALWRGRALSDLEGFSFAETEARRLEDRRLAVTDLAFAADLAEGAHALAIPAIRDELGRYPYHEPFYEQLMLALYRSGRGAEAIEVYDEAERLFDKELGIGPSQTLRSIQHSIAIGDSRLDLPGRQPPNNLALTLSSFVGRESEIDSLVSTLPERRLLTLTGVGGSGKSRLSIEVALRVLDRYSDGVWRIELAPLRRREAVLSAIGSALGEPGSHAVDPMQSILDYLQGGRALLIMDNCEHLLEPIADAVGTILERCPGVSVMATSREPLGIPGESVWLVPPLHIPEPDQPPDDLERVESVRLFVSRAADTYAGFELDDGNREAVFRICRLVDGLPLALELAAGRVSSLTPEQLADRLTEDIGVLAAKGAVGRHRTMRAALDWSFQLLDEEGQEVFAGLAVFRGGWTIEDCQAVLGDASAEIVAGLVDRSLVERLRSGTLDYRLLEPVREYALEILQASVRFAEVSRRHAEHYLALAVDADRGLRGSDQVSWRRLMEAEHDNIRRALQWALDSDETELALRLIASLGWFWFMAGHWKESFDWLLRALDAAGEAHPAARAAAVYRTGAIQVIRVNHETVMPLVEEALDNCRTTGDRYGEAWCQHLVGHAAAYRDPEDAMSPLGQAREIFAEMGCDWEVAWSDRYIGADLCELDRVDEGLELMLRSVSAFREMGDMSQTAFGLYMIGGNLLALPDHGAEEARPYLERCQRLSDEIGDRVWSAHAFSRLAMVARATGDDDPGPLFVEAVERHRLIGDDVCVSNCLGLLGEIRRDSGDEKAAAECYGEALRVARRINSRFHMAVNFVRLVRLAEHRDFGDRGRRLMASIEGAVARGEVRLVTQLEKEYSEVMALLGVSPVSDEPLEDLLPLALEIAESIRTSG